MQENKTFYCHGGVGVALVEHAQYIKNCSNYILISDKQTHKISLSSVRSIYP